LDGTDCRDAGGCLDAADCRDATGCLDAAAGLAGTGSATEADSSEDAGLAAFLGARFAAVVPADAGFLVRARAAFAPGESAAEGTLPVSLRLMIMIVPDAHNAANDQGAVCGQAGTKPD
jgi:hypothetical protein